MTPDPVLDKLTERERVQEKLLIRGNTLGGVIAAVLMMVGDGRADEIPEDEIRGYEQELRAWTADVRAVASEERP